MAVERHSPQLDLAPPKPWRRFVPSWLRSLIWIDSVRKYDAFLSYSWKSDSEVAPVIQSLIQRFLCPWYKLRAKTVFRDLSCLPAGSSLENELFDRLDCSTYLIVLASPEAATSQGMEIEAQHWFSSKPNGEVVVIVSSGDDGTWEDIRDHLLPPAVRNKLTSPPVWASLRRRRDKILTNPRDHMLHEELVEDLKQVLLRFYPNRDWGQLRGEERSQRRRALALLLGFALLLLALAILALYKTFEAQSKTRLAVSRQLAAQAIAELWSNPRSSVKDALEAIAKSETDEAKQALDQALSQSNVTTVLSDPDKAPLSAAAFSRNEGFIVTSTYWGKVWSWACATSKPLHYFPSGGYFRVSADSLRSDGKYLLTTLDDKDGYWVVIYDFRDGSALGRFRASRVGPVISATFSPSGKYIATAGEDFGAAVWDATAVLNALHTSTEPKDLAVAPIEHYDRLHTDIINSVRFAKNEDYVVTSSQDGRAKIWDWKSHRVFELRRYTRALFSAEFHPRNIHTVLTAGQDGHTTVWTDAFSKHISIDRQWHKLDALQASFDASGLWVVTASSDGKAVVWNPGDESKNYTLVGHRGAVTGAAFSPEGRYIVTASVDGTARIWITKPVPDLKENQAKIQYLKNLLLVR